MTNEILGGDGIGDEAPSGEALASDSMAYQSLVGSGLVALSLSDVYQKSDGLAKNVLANHRLIRDGQLQVAQGNRSEPS